MSVPQTKLVISFGLVALTCFACGLIIVGQRVAPRIEQSFGIYSEVKPPQVINFDTIQTGGPSQTLPVNSSAAGEIKRQGIGCSQCQTPCQCVNCTCDRCDHPAQSIKQQAPSVVAVKPTQARYSLTVFVSTDRQSQEILNWLNTDPALVKFKKSVDYQAYGQGNALYQARYANTMPAGNFPALIFADPTGGHVYVATTGNMPTTASGLMASIRDSYTKHKAAKAATPAQDLNYSGDCPDGNCKQPLLNPDRGPLINPDRGPLFPDVRPPSVESLLWSILNPGESLAILLCAFVFVLLCITALFKVSRS